VYGTEKKEIVNITSSNMNFCHIQEYGELLTLLFIKVTRGYVEKAELKPCL